MALQLADETPRKTHFRTPDIQVIIEPITNQVPAVLILVGDSTHSSADNLVLDFGDCFGVLEVPKHDPPIQRATRNCPRLDDLDNLGDLLEMRIEADNVLAPGL